MFYTHDSTAFWHGSLAVIPATRGPMRPQNYGSFARQRLSTDGIGSMTLTLTNLVVGSAIRIEVASTGALVTSRTAAGASETFTLDYYAGGNANNDLRIKVRKASGAPFYKPYETQAVLSAAAKSVFVAQILD